ncbi:hypothetical protein C8F04DRAFT_384649 [Mycena alexandri]|uniref:Uncharacterized protein n=1 Tax=Mycena alexandri TaxID=1745969 RepID=A0AAD6T5V9_9AGAR|nr:hypothetical protein C8F04DRAFT_384649 [Mycena alexandri]
MASQSNYPDLEFDIADHQLDGDDDELPPRPTSRLSFNGEVAVAQTVPPTRPRAVSWTKNLLHKIRIPLRVAPDVDMDITAVSPDEDDDDLDPVSLPILPSLSAFTSTSMDVDDEYDDSDSDGYSSGDSDIDLDSPAEYGVPLFPPVPQSIPPPAPAPSPTPYARRTKYNALPSPLSPGAHPAICRTTPLRHAYGHHGRSRHALLHLKFLWALREDAHDNNNKSAYSAMRARLNNTTASACALPPTPMTIHPRTGDLCALRDPYPAHMDRCFGGMPLWTMGKTLWMYDVHLGVAAGMKRVCAQDDRDEESESDDSDSILAASVSGSTAEFSDHSDDSTLVGSGSEEEVDLIDLDGEVEVAVEEKKATTRSRAASFSPSPAESKPQPQPKSYSKRAPPPPRPVWETSWYKRWEVLLELVKIDTERERVSRSGPTIAPNSNSVSTPAPASKELAVRAPRFFIGEPDDDDEEQWDEILGEEDEDEVMIVSHSVWC